MIYAFPLPKFITLPEQSGLQLGTGAAVVEKTNLVEDT